MNFIASKNIPLVLVVAAALIDSAGRVLVAERPQGKAMAGLWEFPGGKLNTGEIPEHALVRELEEELGIQVLPQDLEPVAFASHGYKDFHLLMPLFLCRKWNGTISAQEHKALQWIFPKDLHGIAMPEADVPLIEKIQKILGPPLRS